jgi:hypothetical protein
MERNADDLSGSAGGTGSGGYGNSGDVSGSSGYAAGAAGGSTAGTSGSSYNNTDSGIADRARNVAGSAKEKLANVGSTVREQAGTAKDKLADALESGADKLRQRTQGGSQPFAGETGSTSVAVSDNRMNQVTDKVAGGMQATADWLRDADLDSMRAGVERQVKEHPGRTLLIAVGLGYLLGKAFRK